MASKILRRSGVSFVQFCDLLDWQGEAVYMVGVGPLYQELDVFQEEWPGVQIFGFEANTNTYNSIKDAFEKRTGRLFNAVISNKVGKEALYYKTDWKAGSSLYKPREEPEKWRTMLVDSYTLDSAINLQGTERKRGVLWLDCEGNEYNVLLGAEEFIKGIDIVNVEMTARPRNEGWCKPIDVHNWLVSHGFAQAYIHTTRSGICQYDAIYVRNELYREDASMIHSESVRLRNLK